MKAIKLTLETNWDGEKRIFEHAIINNSYPNEPEFERSIKQVVPRLLKRMEETYLKILNKSSICN